MKTGQASGLQIAFLMFAVMIAAVPFSALIIKHAALQGVAAEAVRKGMHFALAIILILSFSPLRQSVRRWLKAPLGPQARIETAIVTASTLLLAFATAGAIAAWFWLTEGPGRVERMTVDLDKQLSRAFSSVGLVTIALSVLVAPVVEEIVFRGFIYRAFERRWGWLAAMLATSALFGMYHTYPWSAFVSSIVFVCVMRRTGSLWAPIVVHVIFNLMLWWPFLGQFVFPREVALAEARTWTFHFSSLAIVLVAVPIYVWMSRDRLVVAPTVFLESHGALSK